MTNIKITTYWFLGAFLAVPLLVEARPQFAEKQIRLTATIPADEVSGNLVSYPLDGDFKRLFYNVDTNRFNDIWFYVRTEAELSSTPGGYSFIQTYNNLSCYGGATSDVVEMGIKINNQAMSSGRVNLTGADLWYRGADKYYSDIPIEMSSPVINNDKTKWCTGQVSLVVQRSLI
ncbi:hypothetical protein M2G23_09625 [Vibrio vulnificus]|uniref:hypothetical protein n=1 Tax=Vibrio vulnificus TaxID=672 RepID=UPI001A233902|nr:hypothetical protein [Vibrio vulnificus]ELK8602544.1 hypothetical protein [Vibrio vulnificus]MCG6290823.1 hypothetical protein [Vibrio vulnificus]MCU8546095.1 hypothetical protein [Vibrio vulnificus]MCU8577618.1 hypothetical protein [Vibrio vulnificus]HAS8264137.1 hypothetical protein [Vibrio vulnificus]